jgi:hypothetical protein
LLKNQWRAPQSPSGVKARFDFARLAARLKAPPFQNKVKGEFFSKLREQELSGIE